MSWIGEQYNKYCEGMELENKKPLKYEEWLELWNEEREVR